MNKNIVILTAFLNNQPFELNVDQNKSLKKIIIKELGFNQVAKCEGVYKGDSEEGFIVGVKKPEDVTKLLDIADFYSQESILYVDELGQAYLIGYDKGTRFDQHIGTYTRLEKEEIKDHDSYTRFDHIYFGVIK